MQGFKLLVWPMCDMHLNDKPLLTRLEDIKHFHSSHNYPVSPLYNIFPILGATEDTGLSLHTLHVHHLYVWAWGAEQSQCSHNTVTVACSVWTNSHCADRVKGQSHPPIHTTVLHCLYNEALDTYRIPTREPTGSFCTHQGSHDTRLESFKLRFSICSLIL